MSEKQSKEQNKDEKVEKSEDNMSEALNNQKEEFEPEIISRDSEIEELQTKLKEAEERSMRAYAESENIRKRADKERREILKLANKSLLASLIGFMDDFDRALKSGSENEDINKTDFYKGIELIHKRFLTFLDDNGVKELDCLGEEFNPNIHEALQAIEKEGIEFETVVEIYMKGYTLNDEILRTAKVIIGKPKG